MAELKRLLSSRRGYRAHLTKLLQAVTEILNGAQPLSEANTAALKDLHEQLERKKELISSLDARILEATTEDSEIEAEVLQAEEVSSSISTAKAKIAQRLTPTSSASAATPPRRTDAHTLPASLPVHEHFTRLPKLDLPQFTGNPLHWQSFWDCFEAAVHTNASLSEVQKLSYLRAQLHGDAARIIAGLQLSNDNYTHSVTLLKERFGQTYKQVDAHLQALIDLPSPNNLLSSLREFHDATEGHIRSLSTLGKPQDSYGSLLIPILLGKLPSKVKQNLVRAHGKREWTLSELQTAILNELYILEMGSQTEPLTSAAPPTASFLTATKKSSMTVKTKLRCPFCAGPHNPSMCESVKDPKQRCDIVRQNKLCYNCLGHHKVSACNSRHRCRNCQRKHHTSLCTNDQHNNTSQHPTQPAASQQNPSQPLVSQQSPAQPPVSQQNLVMTSRPPATTNTTFGDSASLSVSAPSPQNTVCLLKTAVATITNGSKHTRANLLFDEGSQRSFIT